MRRFIVPLVAASLLASPVWAQVSRPRSTATPQPDAHAFGLPEMPSPVPTCAANSNGGFADGVGCVYWCAGRARRLVAAGDAACSFPTGAPSASPTPTATATLTPTPTITVTP